MDPAFVVQAHGVNGVLSTLDRLMQETTATSK